MTQTKYQPTPLSLRVRALLKEGRPIPEIMALTGAQRQVVGVIKYHMERQENARISPATGKPVRKYTKKKRKVAKPPVKKAEALIVLPKGQLMQLQQEIETLTTRVAEAVKENNTLRNRRPIEIEVPVPQPFSHYTFAQRLRILFFGGAA